MRKPFDLIIISISKEHRRDLFFEVPEPVKKRVPLTYEDLLERAKSGKTMWVAGDSSTILITYFDPTGYVCYGDLSSNTSELADSNYHFADGDPCWKEVEEGGKK